MIFPTTLSIFEVLDCLWNAYKNNDLRMIPFECKIAEPIKNNKSHLAIEYNSGYTCHIYDEEIFVCSPNESIYSFHYVHSDDKESYCTEGDGWYKRDGKLTFRNYKINDVHVTKNLENNNTYSASQRIGNCYYKVQTYSGYTERSFSCSNDVGSVYLSEIYENNVLRRSSITARDANSEFHTIDCIMDNGLAEYSVKKGFQPNIKITLPLHEPGIEYLWNKYDTFLLEVDDGFEDIMYVRDSIWNSLNKIFKVEGKSAHLRDIISGIRSQIEATDENII